MKRATRLGVLVLIVLGGVEVSLLWAKKEPQRPKISGIAAVWIDVSDLRKAQEFYKAVTGTGRVCDMCETKAPRDIRLMSGQYIFLADSGTKPVANRIQMIVFETDDLKKLGDYLKYKKVEFHSSKQNGVITAVWLQDPEDHKIGFHDARVPFDVPALGPSRDNSFSVNRMIHAGFVVRDRATMDRFYEDVLGFRLY